ncbi:MAG: molybdopterin adenylyltransferase [Nitrosomonadales bacterium]
MNKKFIKIGLISTSDRAYQGIYEDKGIPELQSWLEETIEEDINFISQVIPDEFELIKNSLIQLVDIEQCHLIFTTGGTGPAIRDVTPDATEAIADRVMPGFGEIMRRISLHFVPTAILSRQTAVIRNKTLIVNLPGQPKAIKQILGGLKDDQGKILVEGLFASIPYCIELLNGPVINTNPTIIKAFRPKK